MGPIITATDARRVDPVDTGRRVSARAYGGGVDAPLALPAPAGLATCQALAAYDDLRGALVGLKNRDERGRIGGWADALAPMVPRRPGLVVTWAPTSSRRRRQRGFDQAELLARAVARRRGLRAVPLLRRRGGPPQQGRGAADRLCHPGFLARPWRGPVLLVDDVLTTGSTLTAAAEALLAAGAQEVHGLVVARAQPADRR
jgi:predicted amidophosphoribosyltransferase